MRGLEWLTSFPALGQLKVLTLVHLNVLRLKKGRVKREPLPGLSLVYPNQRQKPGVSWVSPLLAAPPRPLGVCYAGECLEFLETIALLCLLPRFI